MPHVGAQLRYLKELTHGILGAVGFATPALALADRDEWIDWAPGVFCKRLHRTLGLSRILIRPSVRCRCLASQMLNQTLRRLPGQSLAVLLQPLLTGPVEEQAGDGTSNCK